MLEPLGKYETAMVVTAHPDDAEFGCSGTVARWISEGTQVVYVLVTDGSKGTEDLAKNVVEACKKNNKKNFKYLYTDETPILKKVETIAKEIYGANRIEVDDKVKEQVNVIEKSGFGKFPVCIAKTQYSFSTDPKLKGAPSGHILPIREVRLSSGAGFVVVICGSIMTMPGLPRVPAADSIKLNKKGEIEGLF